VYNLGLTGGWAWERRYARISFKPLFHPESGLDLNKGTFRVQRRFSLKFSLRLGPRFFGGERIREKRFKFKDKGIAAFYESATRLNRAKKAPWDSRGLIVLSNSTVARSELTER